MQTLVEHQDVRNMLSGFAGGVLADNYSWRDWYVVSVVTRPVTRGLQHGKLVVALRSVMETKEGLIAWDENGLCLCVCYSPQGIDTHEFENELKKRVFPLNAGVRVIAYSIIDQPDEVLQLITPEIVDVTLAPTLNVDQMSLLSRDVHQYEDIRPFWEKTRLDAEARSKPSIMVVDDDCLTRGIISHALKGEYALLTAETAADAVRKHILHAPNIIFMDIDLPDHDGLSCLRHIRQYDAMSHIIMFSGNGYLTNRLQAFSAGANGFIPKPFHRPVFEHYITQWRHARRAKRRS